MALVDGFEDGLTLDRCLGEMLANMLVETSWSLLLRNYDFTLLDDELAEPDWAKALSTPFVNEPVPSGAETAIAIDRAVHASPITIRLSQHELVHHVAQPLAQHPLFHA